MKRCVVYCYVLLFPLISLAGYKKNQEDAECPLCLEEMDISDLNFKPCICGYQVVSVSLLT